MALVSKQTEKIILVAIGLGAVGVLLAARKGAQVVKDNINLVNPGDETNIINQGVSSVVQTATDGKSKSLGDYLFCLLNPNATICNPKAAALNQTYDTSEFSTEQIDLLYEQEQDFLSEDNVQVGGASSGTSGFRYVPSQDQVSYKEKCYTDADGQKLCSLVKVQSNPLLNREGQIYY